MARLAVAHLRHIASLTRYRFTDGYCRETRFTWNTLFTSCSEYFSCSPLLCRSILISWICSRWLLSMLFMVSAAEDWLPFSFIGESSDGEDEGIDQGFGACPDLWIHGSKSTIYSLIPDDYFKEQLRVRKETFEVILNHLNPHLTREDTAMHDYHQRKCLLLDFMDSSVCLQTWYRHIIDSSPLFFTSFARYDPLRGRTSDPLILCPAKVVCR